jgi:hypothetical protein
MMAQQLPVDHATVAGRDLKAMERALATAGLSAEYGGPHSNHATEMSLVSFPDGSYLELIAIQPQADPAALAAHEWHKYLEGDAGPCSWAVRPTNIAGEADRLRATGVKVSELRKNGRKRPDGVQLEWETAQVGPSNGTFFPFMIHDFTPRERRAYPSGKPTSSQWAGIKKVVIGVKDLDGAIAQFEHTYGLKAPERQDDPEFGAKLAWFRGTPVVLAAAMGEKSWLAERIRRFGDAPCAYVLGASGSFLTSGKVSSWFGKAVAWADPERLGWRLGFEPK